MFVQNVRFGIAVNLTDAVGIIVILPQRLHGNSGRWLEQLTSIWINEQLLHRYAFLYQDWLSKSEILLSFCFVSGFLAIF